MMRVSRLFWTVPLLVFAAPNAVATQGRPAPAAPATVLIGQSWLGLWRGGRIVASRYLDDWQFGPSRLSRDGRIVEVAASRVEAQVNDDTVLWFDARTLAPRGQGKDATLSDARLRVSIGVDLGVPDDRVALAQTWRGAQPRIAAGDRVVLSPDGNMVAVFVKPAHAGAAWRGTAMRRGLARAFAPPGLFIDDGSGRENEARRDLACLLPRGEGAIFTYIGQPADRESEFQSFAPGARPVTLTVPYVMSCLAPSGP